MKKVYLAVDVGSNWLGDRKLAQRYIELLAGSTETSAVKFQIFGPQAGFEGKGLDFETAAFTRDWAKTVGVDWFASVFRLEDIKPLVELGPKFIKIAARNSGDVAMVQEAARQDIPTIISVSSQYRTMPKRGDYMNFFGSRAKYKLAYCVSHYPTDPKDVSLAAARAFDGFSDHTVSLGVPLAMASAGLEAHDWFYLEVHGILDDQPRNAAPDGVCSKTLSQVRILADALHDLETLG